MLISFEEIYRNIDTLSKEAQILLLDFIQLLKKRYPQPGSENHSSYRARSLGTSLLASRKTPVALVLDADTDNESQIFEKRDLINYVLRQVSSGIPFQVFLGVPQLEIVFLQNKSLIEKIAQRQFNDLEWQLSQSKPKEFLETVFGNNQQINARIFSNINDEEIRVLQQHPLIQEIITFLSSLITSSVAIN